MLLYSLKFSFVAYSLKQHLNWTNIFFILGLTAQIFKVECWEWQYLRDIMYNFKKGDERLEMKLLWGSFN